MILRINLLASLALPLIAAASPAPAANFAPPQGCTLEVTVQNRSCTVNQVYRCEADTEGDQWSATFDEGGLSYLSRIDAETRWMDSTTIATGLRDTLEEGATDDASFSTLLETGRDSFDFWTVSNTGERLHHVGHDELTGETVTIDGVELERTRFSLQTFDGTGELLVEREGQQYVSRAMGRFFGGIETFRDWTGDSGETNDSPVTFSFPGERGFASTTPEFDCDMMMALMQRYAAPSRDGGSL